jgi:hypothetical protein
VKENIQIESALLNFINNKKNENKSKSKTLPTKKIKNKIKN